VVDEVFPHTRRRSENADHGQFDGPLADDAAGFDPWKQTLHLPDHAGRRVGRTIHCQVLEVKPNENVLPMPGKAGMRETSDTAHGSTPWSRHPFQGRNGTRLRLVHSGFVLPKNDAAFKNMSEGWKKVVRTLALSSTGRTDATEIAVANAALLLGET